jgi:hypothetical protein
VIVVTCDWDCNKGITNRTASSVAKRVQLGFISDQVTPTLYNLKMKLVCGLSKIEQPQKELG